MSFIAFRITDSTTACSGSLIKRTTNKTQNVRITSLLRVNPCNQWTPLTKSRWRQSVSMSWRHAWLRETHWGHAYSGKWLTYSSMRLYSSASEHIRGTQITIICVQETNFGTQRFALAVMHHLINWWPTKPRSRGTGRPQGPTNS